ncbi:hypothetical protein GCM10011351_14280 [Paraliobacillus quinghaiensis]|uniref:PucR C-terminal helix-turn-helix domain-containing protein n=1 Tax=Paraliobacillus quinghaiensis TaxID=470815 RepID=A0A917WT04_9BACI|nr:helix-turn-helix domain-containing protein [Paraliobacillus quinghaiensis]GGM29325.1 hypothetical protein GCM10011351_14280 [Paraliobacillus quinghaiensis]
MVTFSDLYSSLKSYQPTLILSNKDTNIEDFTYLTALKDIDNKYVYISDVSALENQIEKLIDTTLIVIIEEPLNTELIQILDNNSCNVITCEKVNSPIELFDTVRNIFNQEVDYLQQVKKLYDYVITQSSLQEVLTFAEELLGNPVLIIDESFKIIDYSKQIPIIDHIWKVNSEKGYCSYEFIKEVTKYKAIQEAPLSEEPFCVTCKQSNNNKIVSKIFIGKKLRGYIVVLECNRKVPKHQIKIIPEISKVIGHYLTHQLTSYLNLEEKLIIDLIEKKIDLKNELEERKKACGNAFSKDNYLLAIKAKESNISKKYNSKIQLQLAKLFPQSKQFIYKNYIVVLISFRDAIHFDTSNREQLTLALEKDELIGIISDHFKEIKSIGVIFDYLVSSLEIGEIIYKDKHYLESSEMKFFNLLRKMDSKEDLLSCCHPAIITIYEYDQKHHTDYYHTLFVYLLNNQNIHDAAESLYIHRNTMKNRLKKINKLVNIDLLKGEVSFQLFYSYKILTYIHCLN